MNLTAKISTILPKEAKEIRTTVFVNEQGFNEEFDSDDNKAIHIVLFDGGLGVATARIIYSNNHHSYVIGRVAVIKPYRNKGIGKKIMEIAEQEIVNRFGHIEIGVSAQDRAKEFYRKIGYNYTNETYLDEGYPHIWMIKKL